MIKKLLLAFKGFVVGASLLVPGISGGTMAIMLGFYDGLIEAVGSFFKDVKKNIVFLGLLGIGGIVGVILVANPLLHLTENYPFPTRFFFTGAVAGSIPMIVKRAEAKLKSPATYLYILLGAAVVVGLTLLPITNREIALNGIGEYFYVALTGTIVASALILPGISGAFVLMMMGMYETSMHALVEFNIPFLAAFGVGILIGALLIVRILQYILRRFPRQTYLVIIGFLLSSFIELFPGFPGGLEILLCIVTFLAGFLGIYKLSQMDV